MLCVLLHDDIPENIKPDTKHAEHLYEYRVSSINNNRYKVHLIKLLLYDEV